MNYREGGQKKLKIFTLGVLFAISVALLLQLVVGKVFYINRTDSAPKGIYMVSLNQKLHYGDYVIVSLPVDMPLLQVPKGFLLLKQVRGFPGDVYCVSEEAMEIHGESYTIYRQEGLPQLKAGERTIPEDEIILLNERELSFDSRYLGPIEKSQIVTKVELLVAY